MQLNSKQNNHLSFNEQCYQLLNNVPKGRVTTYKAIAQALNSNAYQAVGNAMHRNPNPFTTPCHRVVNSDGRLGGFVFGSERKLELLRSEGIVIVNDKVQNFSSVFYDAAALSLGLYENA